MWNPLRRKRLSPQKEEVIRKYEAHVSPARVAFFRKYGIDFVMGAREGPFLTDLDGEKRLYNLHCNGGVFNLGHRNPELRTLLKEALESYDIGNHHLLSQPRAELAALLAHLMPGPLQYTVFGVGGGEAVDIALKLARRFTQRRKILYARGAYHGHTGLAVLAGEPQYRKPFLLESPDFQAVPFNNLPALEAAMGPDVAAVILETIPATLGMPVPDRHYLPGVKAACQRHGALLILDEVQAGLGRTGRLWAFEHFDVVPDMVVLGKGLSGGLYPISATVVDRRLESILREDPFLHISTFGGAEPGCLVAQSVLKISSQPDFLARVRHLSIRIREALEPLKTRHSILTDISGMGLMLALVLSHPMAGPVLTRMAYDEDLLLVYANHDTARVQFLPPLIMEETDIPWIMERLDRAFTRTARWLKLFQAREKLKTLFQR